VTLWVGLTLSAQVGWGTAGLVALLVLAMVVRRWARRRTELRALVLAHQYWHYLERSVRHAGWNSIAAEMYLQYVGNRFRRVAFGRRFTEMNVYRIYRRIAAPEAACTVRSTWFHAIMFFIPRHIRAPWFDHLLEDRDRMAAQGHSRAFITWATAIQCICLLIHLVWEQVWDMLTPFKPRSH
jgi:hypothetical protein